MKIKQVDNLFGKAMKAYYNVDRSKFYFKMKSEELFEHRLSRYFREIYQLSKAEKKLMSLAYGDILDIGCGTGNYIPLLMKYGEVLGIDISPDIIEIAQKNGLKNCIIGDIFNFSINKKYDTITLLENNIGMGGTLEKTKRLMKIFSNLLNKDGQILAIANRVVHEEYITVELEPVWKGYTGKSIGWIHLNINYLSNLCRHIGFNLDCFAKSPYAVLCCTPISLRRIIIRLIHRCLHALPLELFAVLSQYFVFLRKHQS